MQISFDDKKFRPRVTDNPEGDVNSDTVFHYREAGSIVWATYTGGVVDRGTLIARKSPDGALEMRYQHFTVDGTFKSGHCTTLPIVRNDGSLELHETWEWLEGDVGAGTSVLEEIT
ncbi:MAG: n-acetylglutamate synthase [Rhodothermales bacterium]|nr:n-acetylglutamate synthase [Rhodothermales bacterium]